MGCTQSAAAGASALEQPSGHQLQQMSSQRRRCATGIADDLLGSNSWVSAEAFAARFSEVGMRGYGTSGEVFTATDATIGSRVAIKAIEKKTDDGVQRTQVLREIGTMKMLERHPNAIKLHAVLQDNDRFYMVLDVCEGGELYEHIQSRKDSACFPEQHAASIVRSILSFVAHMHSVGIGHMDLKPENIMFDRDNCEGVLKIIDFGSSHFLHANEYAYGAFGSVHYCSPEMAAEQGVSQSTDIWSVGVIMYYMLFGKLPFNKSSELETLEHLADRPQVDFKAPECAAASSEAKECLLAMLHVDCERRPSAQQVLQMAWLQRSTNCSQYPAPQIASQLLTLQAASYEGRLWFWHVAGHLRGKEANQLLSLFYTIDSNFSGIIEVKELETFLRKGSADVSSEAASHLFNLLDVHNTGIISAQELFAGVLCASSPSVQRAAVLKVFNALGCDELGRVQNSAIFDMLKARKIHMGDADVLASEVGVFGDADGHIGFDDLVHVAFTVNTDATKTNTRQQAQDGAESQHAAKCAVPATLMKLQPSLLKGVPATQEEISLQPAPSSLKSPASCTLADAAVMSASSKTPIKPVGAQKLLAEDTATKSAASGSAHCSRMSVQLANNHLPKAEANTSSDILRVQASSGSLHLHPGKSQGTSIRPFSPTPEEKQHLNVNFSPGGAALQGKVRTTLDRTDAGTHMYGALEQNMRLQLSMLENSTCTQQLNVKSSEEHNKHLRMFNSVQLSDIKSDTDSILTASSPPTDQRTVAWS